MKTFLERVSESYPDGLVHTCLYCTNQTPHNIAFKPFTFREIKYNKIEKEEIVNCPFHFCTECQKTTYEVELETVRYSEMQRHLFLLNCAIIKNKNNWCEKAINLGIGLDLTDKEKIMINYALSYMFQNIIHFMRDSPEQVLFMTFKFIERFVNFDFYKEEKEREFDKDIFQYCIRNMETMCHKNGKALPSKALQILYFYSSDHNEFMKILTSRVQGK